MLECKANFAQIILHWRAEMTTTFISYLPDDLIPEAGEDLTGSQILDLAVSVFRCTKDHTVGHFFPRLLDYFPVRTKAEATVQATPHQQELDWPHKDWYTFDSITSSVVRQILIACGANPSNTTREQLDEMDPRVVCMTCAAAKSPPSIYGPTMSWKRAVRPACVLQIFCTLKTYTQIYRCITGPIRTQTLKCLSVQNGERSMPRNGPRSLTNKRNPP